jgi:hypothetical protein
VADQNLQTARANANGLRSWIVRHPIASFLVLGYATSWALTLVPDALTEPGHLPAEQHRTELLRMCLDRRSQPS